MLHIQYYMLFIYNEIKLCRYTKYTDYFQMWSLGKKIKIRNPVSTQNEMYANVGLSDS